MNSFSFIKIVKISFPLWLFTIQLFGQTLEEKTDSLLLAKYPKTEAGGCFLIAKKGDILYQKAFGMANLEHAIPMQTNAVFEIGSLTKQFTALAILQLGEQGKLTLQDPITKYLPEFPVNEGIITIHHLLTHTSGIKDFTSLPNLESIAKSDINPLDFIKLLEQQAKVFTPGEQFQYCNAGYIILGYIIEQLSGMTYADYISKNIFEKLKMEHSYYANHSKVIPNRAYGYQDKKGIINRKAINYSIPYAAGALMSSVEDLWKWQEGIRNNQLVSKKWKEKAFTNYTLNNGQPINYGYGWHIREINGQKTYEHGGSIFGFKSMGVYIPEQSIYVIALTNSDFNSPTEITKKIAEIASQTIKN